MALVKKIVMKMFDHSVTQLRHDFLNELGTEI